MSNLWTPSLRQHQTSDMFDYRNFWVLQKNGSMSDERRSLWFLIIGLSGLTNEETVNGMKDLYGWNKSIWIYIRFHIKEIFGCQYGNNKCMYQTFEFWLCSRGSICYQLYSSVVPLTINNGIIHCYFTTFEIDVQNCPIRCSYLLVSKPRHAKNSI